MELEDASEDKAAQAQLDLTTAYLYVAGLQGGAVLAGDLSGLTFAPGLYKNSTTVMLSAGNVTLDAQGDSNAVFIFQIGSTLTTLGSTQVILAGNAQGMCAASTVPPRSSCCANARKVAPNWHARWGCPRRHLAD